MTTTDDVIRVRRATSSDYRDVVDINDDVFEGFDYIPTVYEKFTQSPDEYAAYVAETDKKLVALAIFGLDYPDDDAYLMGLRVRPGYEGRGFIRLLRKHFLAEYPSITHFVYNGMMQPAIVNKLKKCTLLWQSNIVAFRVDGSKLSSWLQSTDSRKQSSVTSSVVQPISDVECQELVSSGQCQQILSRYAVDYVPSAGTSWEQASISNKRQLAEKLSQMTVTTTYGERLSDGSSRELSCLCYSGYYELKTRSKAGHIGAHFYLYGDNIDSLIEHFRIHLLHVAENICRIQSDDDDESSPNVYMAVQFPLSFDRKQMASLMTERLRYAPNETVLQTVYDSTVYYVREIAS